jgi:hypothetical protein
MPNKKKKRILIQSLTCGFTLPVVYVHNAGYPAMYDTTTVTVTVLDENDNAPVFSPTTTSMVLNIPENAIMAVVHTVDAYDADAGDNGLVSYYISGKKK